MDDLTVDIRVGLRKFRIQRTENPKFDPKSPPHNFSSINMVFDTHATKDDGGKSIPNVLPSFLSGPGSSSTSDHGADAVSRTDSLAPSTCSSVVEMSGVEADSDQASDHPFQNGATGNVLRRCITIDDSTLAELLLQKDEMLPDAGKVSQNQDASPRAGGQHLLLRQLLVNNQQANTNVTNTPDNGQDGVATGQSTRQGERRPARNRVLSLETLVRKNSLFA